MNKVCILIVDDNEADRYLLKRQLKQTKLEVDVIEKANGQEALDFFDDYNGGREKCPELYPPLIVFLDVNMPLLNGFEFLEKFDPVRAQLDSMPSFVVFFSSSDNKAEIEKAFSYDYVKQYLVKGQFSADDLKAEIEKIKNS